MRLLAIESSAKTASAAIWDDGIVVAEYTTNHKMTHSQTLLPMIDEIVKRTGVNLADISAIAISKGPGSFTGLRIGSATAKGLGQALNLPIVEVPTLEGLAYNLSEYEGLVCPCMDARRNHVYGAIYTFEGGKAKQVCDTSLIEASGFVELVGRMAKETGKKPAFLGDGVGVVKAVLEESADFEYKLALPGNSTHRAASVAQSGSHRYEQGLIITAKEHVPDYLRPSQAEREMEQK